MISAHFENTHYIIHYLLSYSSLAAKLDNVIAAILFRGSCKNSATQRKGFALEGKRRVVERVWLPTKDWPGLAMARSFGDFCLKDFGLISVPDISYRRLTERDEFIMLATDGVSTISPISLLLMKTNILHVDVAIFCLGCLFLLLNFVIPSYLWLLNVTITLLHSFS